MLCIRYKGDHDKNHRAFRIHFLEKAGRQTKEAKITGEVPVRQESAHSVREEGGHLHLLESGGSLTLRIFQQS